MGQEPSQSVKDLDEPDIDVMSQIYQKGPKDMQQRLIEAVRISELDRNNEPMLEQEGQFKKTDSEIEPASEPSEISKYLLHPDLFRLSKGSAKEESPACMMEGVLEKQSPSMFGQASPRYCILTEKRFVYKSTLSPMSETAGILNFDLLSCYVVEKSHIFTIRVQGSDKEFTFRSVKGDKLTKEWAGALRKVTEKSPGRVHNLTYLSHYHRFWRKDYFSEKEFRDTSETGDIILMRGRENTAALQRAITQDEFDHIAIVLKNVRHDVLLFEANGGVGVGIMPWHKFVSKKLYKKQEIVVYRKLQVARTEEFLEVISSFVQRNMGRKYKFSVKKFIMNRHSVEEDKNSYFCSSLVAKVFKNLQLLDDSKSSTQYMPSTFSEKEKITLRQNGKYGPAKLGPEKIIVFEEQFFQQ